MCHCSVFPDLKLCFLYIGTTSSFVQYTPFLTGHGPSGDSVLSSLVGLCGWFCRHAAVGRCHHEFTDVSWGPSRLGSALHCPTPQIWLQNLYVWAYLNHTGQTRKKQMTGREKWEREREREEPGGGGQTEKTECSIVGQMHPLDCVEEMPSVSRLEENYHHGNDLADTSTLTSAVILERSACGGWVREGGGGGGGGLPNPPTHPPTQAPTVFERNFINVI